MAEKNRGQIIIILDRLTLIGMGLSILLILQPFWPLGFKVGFFATIAFTIGQVVFSHLLPKGEKQ